MKQRKILFIDDRPKEGNYLDVIEKALPHYEIVARKNGKEGLALLKRDKEISLVLLDIKMPPQFALDEEYEGIAVLKEIRKHHAELPVIMVTVFGTDIEKIIASIKAGAFHYIAKPLDPHFLALQVEKALREQSLTQDISYLHGVISIREELEKPVHIPLSTKGLGRLVGRTDVMTDIYKKIEKLAAMARAPILIMGESGTGKELVALEIHERSERSDYPFMAFNASDEFSSSDPMIRVGKLRGFGKDSGIKDIPKNGQDGILKKADKGTLFLDEVGEMPLDVQAGFLRILQVAEPPEFKSEFFPAAGEFDKPIRVDVRYIFATNKDPKDYINQGKLREDFYYRINVASIHLPPLRTRKEDIPLLVDHFIDKFNHKYNLQIKTIPPEVQQKLMQHDWPGNVRELENKIERAMINAEGAHLSDKDFELDGEDTSIDMECLPTEKMWKLLLEKRMKVESISHFKQKWGEHMLKELIKKAFSRTKSQKEAGRLLGCYTSADEDQKKYSIFRQECTKLGLKIKDFK
jgi:two-component system NtrC family response regulator